MDLPQNPGNYVAAAGQFDAQGRLMVVIQNRAPVALTGMQVTPVLIDASGRIVQQGSRCVSAAGLEPGEQAALDSGIGNVPQEQRPFCDSAWMERGSRSDDPLPVPIPQQSFVQLPVRVTRKLAVNSITRGTFT